MHADRSGEADSSGPVLVTGAAGYVGGRLVDELIRRGYRVRCMVIDSAEVYSGRWPGAEVVTADVRDEDALERALDGVDTAYYLIHSLLPCSGEGVIDTVEEAVSFSRAAADAELNRIIYLGSLLDSRAPAGSCQAGRLHVADELRESGIPVTELRADIIIGSGSAAYEITRNLVRRLPLMLIPEWARRPHLPLWIDDVIACLVGVLENNNASGRSFELCGEELSYEQMLKQASGAIGRKTRFLRFPFTGTAFYSYTASLLTPVPDELARAVIGGLGYRVDCRDRSLNELVPLEPIPFAEAFRRAEASERDGVVVTRWSDAWPHEFEYSAKLESVRDRVDRQARYTLETRAEAAELFATVCEIGGERGWLHNNWMWEMRGAFDRVIKGVGLERGRKRHGRLEVNEVIDFWRVEAIEPDRRLLLRAEMKLPGSGWLEFTIDDAGAVRRLSVTAYFVSRGPAGRIYWYFFYPFHGLIFRKLLAGIVSRSLFPPPAMRR